MIYNIFKILPPTSTIPIQLIITIPTIIAVTNKLFACSSLFQSKSTNVLIAEVQIIRLILFGLIFLCSEVIIPSLFEEMFSSFIGTDITGKKWQIC
ncbi:unnamed protein product [Schistosoma mattheei]|uniref:Uncharacterized protein n=1 Tax=Schistosoma mattheei TaxID=31246 RepID=A0A3P8FQB2_9TREM|nr:unnamed protein product [Schistosoma mattheei]